MKKFVNLSILAILCFTLASCCKTCKKDEAAPAEDAAAATDAATDAAASADEAAASADAAAESAAETH